MLNYWYRNIQSNIGGVEGVWVESKYLAAGRFPFIHPVGKALCCGMKNLRYSKKKRIWSRVEYIEY